MAAISKFNEPNLQAICDILGGTGTGLTGSEIGRFLRECDFPDPLPSMTKRYRLNAAFRAKQNSDGCANNVLHFVTHVMSPVRYVGNREYFEAQRGKLNGVLAFSGLTLGEDGNIREVKAARALSESEAMASALRRALVDRKVHQDVLAFCRAELLVDNYFHAVFEATKSVAEKLRQKSGSGLDGSQLVDEALGIGKAGYPRLAFNSLATESERSEHTGLMNLIKGLFAAFRNTRRLDSAILRDALHRSVCLHR
ncbi:MAG: TIGR02391 family protein [Candidatus Binataceae bacterium]